MSALSRRQPPDVIPLLMALIDGEADEEDRVRGLEVVAADPRLIGAVRDLDLTGRHVLKPLFGAIRDQPAPEHLKHMVRTMGATAGPADRRLAPARADWRAWFGNWQFAGAGALAAALLLVGSGIAIAPLVRAGAEQSVLAGPAVAEALMSVKSGSERPVTTGSGPLSIKVVQTFSDKRGVACREYEAQGQVGLRQYGIACAEPVGWAQRTLLFGPRLQDPWKTAGGGDEALETKIDAIAERMRDGDPLDQDAEAARIAKGFLK